MKLWLLLSLLMNAAAVCALVWALLQPPPEDLPQIHRQVEFGAKPEAVNVR